MLSWEITADWKHDPTLVTEVELNFSAVTNGTRLTLEHRHLDRYGARAAEMVGLFASQGGWDGLLTTYAEVAEKP